MKFYGHANLQQNELQNSVLSTLSTFPATPKQGQVAFVNSTVFICVTAGELPVWVPLTREITAFTFNQDSAVQTWNITHTLNTTSVIAQIYDLSGSLIVPDSFTINSPTTATANFNTSQAGRAVLVTGYFDGNQKPNYAFTFYQSSSSTTWTIVHNLGYYPIVRVFVGNQEVQPATVTFDSTNQVTVTFTTAQAGYARLL